MASPPEAIDFADAGALWRSAVMWRLVGDELDSNIPSVCLPGVKPGLHLTASFNRPKVESVGGDGGRGAATWSTERLQRGDELTLAAQRVGSVDGEMRLSAWLNGEQVVLPTLMVLPR